MAIKIKQLQNQLDFFVFLSDNNDINLYLSS